MIQQRVHHRRFYKKKDLILELVSLINCLENMRNLNENSLRFIMIDNFSFTLFPINDYMKYDVWIAELIKLFKILNNKFYIGVLVCKCSFFIALCLKNSFI